MSAQAASISSKTTKFLDNRPDKLTLHSFSIAVKHSSGSYSHPVHLLVFDINPHCQGGKTEGESDDGDR